MKTLLLLGTAIAVLSGGSAIVAVTGPHASHNPFHAPPSHLLYNQNSNYAGAAVNSQNFTDGSFTGLNDQAADDFVVPGGHVWRITEVDVSGQYYNDTARAASENVMFYKNRNGMPGDAVATFAEVDGAANAGNFAITLPGKGLRLKPGRYWVSVIVNMGFYQQGDLWG